MNIEGINRLDSIRVIVDEMLLTVFDIEKRRTSYVQLHGVASFAAMLALKRGMNQELAAIAGMLHDYYLHKTGIEQFHDQNSAEAVRPILRDLGIFSKEEQRIILNAIFHHENRQQIHDDYAEIIKDAIVLKHYFNNASNKVRGDDAERLRNILVELSMPCDFLIEEPSEITIISTSLSENKRAALADIAEALASKGIIGIPGDKDYRDICQYWPDHNIYQVLKGGWCAAFVFFCCKKAGFHLPIRYPGGKCRFAGVAAWLEWAKFPELQFFQDVNAVGFTPQRGDIVIYEKLISDESHDHIGIVLTCDEKGLLVAEGNMDNKNQSSLVRRDRWEKVLGYIRIDNNYQYCFKGEGVRYANRQPFE